MLSTGRQDFGLLRSTLRALRENPRWDVRLWVGGMHLSDRFGRTIDDLRAEGVIVARELDFIGEEPDPAADATRALAVVSEAIRVERPWALVVAGDRSETLVAGIAATIHAVPIVHIHGGEETEGAIDNACRHALTKLSHLHLVSHERHAQRVIQMGEDPADVIVVGTPGTDNAMRSDLPARDELARDLGFSLERPVVLVTVHPATLTRDPLEDVRAVTAACERVQARYVITLPNADANGSEIADWLRAWARGRDNVLVIPALGERRYWGLLRFADAVLGNSSSGIIEAPQLGVPVVNVGERQRGRLRFGPVADVPAVADIVEDALRAAVDAQGGEGDERLCLVAMRGIGSPPRSRAGPPSNLRTNVSEISCDRARHYNHRRW